MSGKPADTNQPDSASSHYQPHLLEYVGAALFFVLSIVSPIHSTIRPLYAAVLAALLTRYLLLRWKAKRSQPFSVVRHRLYKYCLVFVAATVLALGIGSFVRSTGLGDFGSGAVYFFDLETRQASDSFGNAFQLRRRGALSNGEFEERANKIFSEVNAQYERYSGRWVPIHWIAFDRCIHAQHRSFQRFVNSSIEVFRDPSSQNADEVNLALAAFRPYLDRSHGLHDSGAACRPGLSMGVRGDEMFERISQLLKRNP